MSNVPAGGKKGKPLNLYQVTLFKEAKPLWANISACSWHSKRWSNSPSLRIVPRRSVRPPCFVVPQIRCANNTLTIQHIWHWCKNCKDHNCSQHTGLPLLCHCLPPILPAKPLENMTHLTYQGTFLPAHCDCCARCSPHEHQGCAQIGAKSSWAATLRVLSSAECKVVLMECGSEKSADYVCTDLQQEPAILICVKT